MDLGYGRRDLGGSGLRTRTPMWCLLEWRWDQGGTPYPFMGVSSPAGRGRVLSLKESPVGTKISSLISPTSGSALERAKRVVRDPGETVA